MLNLKNDDVEKEDNMEDVELEEIDVAILEKKHPLWVVLQKYRLEVRRQHHDSQVRGQMLRASEYMVEICWNIGLYHSSCLTRCTYWCKK